ncbi:MAG: type IV pilus secretin PilQ [Thermodesulfobacteriota bacterium]
MIKKKIVEFMRHAVFFLLLSLFMVGCAAKSEMRPEAKQSVAEQDFKPQEESKTDALAAKISRQGSKEVVVLPVGREVNVSPRMKSDTVLELELTPNIPRFALPQVLSDGLVSRMVLEDGDSGGISKIGIFLNSKAQFLLSRPGERSVKLMLAPAASATTHANKPEKAAIKGDSFAEQETRTKISGVDFFTDGEGFVHIQVAADSALDFEPIKSHEGKIILEFNNARIEPAAAKLYQLHRFGTHLKSALLQNMDGSARMDIAVQKKVPMQVVSNAGNKIDFVFMTKTGDGANNKLSSGKEPEQDKNASLSLAKIEKASVNFSEERFDTLFPGMQREYKGQKISINLQDADVEHVLRLISSINDYNLIIDEGVQGRISLRLIEVPWEQALDLVLMQQNLVKIQKGNILRITTAQKREQELEQLRRSKQAELQARQSMEELEEPQTEYIQINYSEAEEIQPKVEEFLSERGKISNDPRTNMLIVSDVAVNLEKIKAVVQKLDRVERQVLIEARIVYATDEFSRSLGVNWGYLYPDQEYQQGRYSKGLNVNTNGLNLPPSAVVGGLDIAGNVAKIAGLDLFSLDAELKLGESQNLSRTISSPRVITLNNEGAEITQGRQIATKAESESGGTTTEYVTAALSLKVTPQITPDNKMILQLDISDDSKVAGSDDIDTKTTKTKLIVDDGETLVIGGVKQISRTRQDNKVPGLSEVPLLGWLFKSEYQDKQKNELLIFIRPKIL